MVANMYNPFSVKALGIYLDFGESFVVKIFDSKFI